MKIIDEQGRLFGRVNVIDFLVVITLCAVLPLCYVAYRVLSKPGEAPKVEAAPPEPKIYKDIEIDCIFIKIEPETLPLLTVGDKESDGGGKTICEILLLDPSQPYEYIFDLGEGRLIRRKDPRLLQMSGKIKLNAEVKDKVLFYKEERLAVGTPFEFKCGKYTAWAVPLADEIKRVKEKPKVEKTLQLYMNVTLTGLSQDEASLISAGDKETDAQGNVIAEIIKKGKIESEVVNVDLGGGYHASSEDVVHKQVVVNMRLAVQSVEDKGFFFNGMPIQRNSPITFTMPKYSVQGRVSLLTETPGTPLTERWIKAKVKFHELMPELVKVINQQDEEKDRDGKIWGRLAAILSTKPSDVLVIQSNKMLPAAHPFSKDIEAVFELLCIEKEGELYYNGQEIKIGNRLIFCTSIYNISGMIIEVER